MWRCKRHSHLCARICQTVGNGVDSVLPLYVRYGRVAPLKRNQKMIEQADEVVAIWDRMSRGMAFVIDAYKKMDKTINESIL